MIEAFIYLDLRKAVPQVSTTITKASFLSNLFVAWENLISSQNFLNCTLCYKLKKSLVDMTVYSL